jgi:hypothetical protein
MPYSVWTDSARSCRVGVGVVDVPAGLPGVPGDHDAGKLFQGGVVAGLFVQGPQSFGCADAMGGHQGTDGLVDDMPAPQCCLQVVGVGFAGLGGGVVGQSAVEVSGEHGQYVRVRVA